MNVWLTGGAMRDMLRGTPIRSQKYLKPGGMPGIGAATHEDLKRRDFIIDAIGPWLNRGSRGLLADPSNGQAIC